MEIIETGLKDCFIAKNVLHGDDRGFFLESFNQQRLSLNSGIEINVKQINFAKSDAGVLRGLHYQLSPHAQSKLVSVIVGSVLDVVVDLRKESPTFGQKTEVLLSEPSTSLFVPKGFAHGYEVLEDNTIFCYAVDSFYVPNAERGLYYNDPKLGIKWSDAEKLISEKDKNNPLLEEAEYNF